MKINLTLLLFILLSASGPSFGADAADLQFANTALPKATVNLGAEGESLAQLGNDAIMAIKT